MHTIGYDVIITDDAVCTLSGRWVCLLARRYPACFTVFVIVFTPACVFVGSTVRTYEHNILLGLVVDNCTNNFGRRIVR